MEISKREIEILDIMTNSYPPTNIKLLANFLKEAELPITRALIAHWIISIESKENATVDNVEIQLKAIELLQTYKPSNG